MPNEVLTKKDILGIEKRVVDVELTISELKEKISGSENIDLSELSELKEKLEDVEDLVLVENAGVIELKKMLDGIQNNVAEPSTTISSDLEERIKKIEGGLTNIPSEIQKPADLQPILDQISSLREDTNGKIKSIEEKIQNIKPVQDTKSGVDVDFLTSRINSLKSSIDDIINKKIETDIKIQGLEKTIGLLENRLIEVSSERLVEELENNKKDLLIANSRMETAEKVIQNISNALQQVEINVNKFESFEKLSLLSKDIETKLERFKFIENELRRLSLKTETMYNDMDKRFDKINNVEGRFKEISEYISNLVKEVEKNKSGVISSIKKEDLNEELRKIIEEVNKRLLDNDKRYVKNDNLQNLNEQVKVLMTRLEAINSDANRIKDIDKKYAEISNVVSNLSKIVDKNREEIISSIKKQDITKEMERGIGEINKKISDLVKNEIKKGNIFPVGEQMIALEKDYKSLVSDMSRRIVELQTSFNSKLHEMEIKNLEKMKQELFKQKGKEIDKTMIENMERKLEDEINKIESSVDRRIEEMQLAPNYQEQQINELLNRIVFLESRLISVESMIQETSRSVPIIIE